MSSHKDHLGTVTRWVFVLAGACFVFVPQYAWTSIWGEWFRLGFPFPALALKLGYMSPESPRGPHFQFHPYIVFNAVIWFAVFSGVQRAVRAGLLSRGRAAAAAVLALLVGGAWFAFGAMRVVTVLIAQSQ